MKTEHIYIPKDLAANLSLYLKDCNIKSSDDNNSSSLKNESYLTRFPVAVNILESIADTDIGVAFSVFDKDLFSFTKPHAFIWLNSKKYKPNDICGNLDFNNILKSYNKQLKSRGLKVKLPESENSVLYYVSSVNSPYNIAKNQDFFAKPDLIKLYDKIHQDVVDHYGKFAVLLLGNAIVRFNNKSIIARKINHKKDNSVYFDDSGIYFTSSSKIIIEVEFEFLENVPGANNSDKDLAADNFDFSLTTFPSAALLKLDHIRANLKELRESNLSSPTDGNVDLFWPENVIPDADTYVKLLLDKPCYAKDPWELVDDNAHVAIDFGTSSTVVAIKKSGQVSLVRLGNFEDAISAQQFENATCLEFVNFEKFMQAWKNQPNKPLTAWSDVLGSHDAKAQIKEHAASGLTSIKTWARKRSSDRPVVLIDENKNVVELNPLDVNEDEKSLYTIGDYKNRPFDPIELYGYYLGLVLNTQCLRGGSIFVDYALSYPVKFDKETKERIRQGLKRGLLRSLPASLVCSEKWQEFVNNGGFRVEYAAPEPVALAVTTLRKFGIEPLEGDGNAFAVFDFGGGTADFAAGFYCLTSDEEYEKTGISERINILNTSGDADLGGEHIVDLLAYEVLRISANSALLQEQDITFALPSGYAQFPGSECLWHYGQESYGNFTQLREALRPIWEGNNEEIENLRTSGTITLNFTNSRAEVKSLSLNIDCDALIKTIKERIKSGLENFFLFWKQTFKDADFKQIHLIFAGNSCKCQYFKEMVDQVQTDLFKEFIKESKAENKNVDDFLKDHYEFLDDAKKQKDGDANSSASADDLVDLNLKNCVAIGLLDLLTDQNLGFYMPDADLQGNTADDEAQAPFDYFVGTFDRRRKLAPKLMRNGKYGEWIDFGLIRSAQIKGRDSIFTIAWSNDAKAGEKDGIAQGQCKETQLRISADYVDWHFMAKAVAPARIEYGFSQSGAIAGDDIAEVKSFNLD